MENPIDILELAASRADNQVYGAFTPELLLQILSDCGAVVPQEFEGDRAALITVLPPRPEKSGFHPKFSFPNKAALEATLPHSTVPSFPLLFISFLTSSLPTFDTLRLGNQ